MKTREWRVGFGRCIFEVFAERATDSGPKATMEAFPKWTSCAERSL